jgi:hypothetical protein
MIHGIEYIFPANAMTLIVKKSLIHSKLFYEAEIV